MDETNNLDKVFFVSYASADQKRVYRLCQLVEQQGIGCWIAPRDVQPGADYGEAIVRAIEGTKATLLFLSAHSNASIHVTHEVERATSKGKRVIPVCLEDVKPSPPLELHLATAHRVDAWRTPLSHLIKQLASIARPTDTKPIDQHLVKIVPKGLRSFDEHDADFFLELLPGPRDRDGLPESIRFWKARIEELDPDKTFRVGVVFGPSGCGKSSLVKAGLLPRLSQSVIPVFVEATENETETRLLKALKKRLPDPSPDDIGLAETFNALHTTGPSNKKILIVLDQFEQWLHANRGEEQPPLVQALSTCDGARVQAILMIRDDFWMPLTRFMGNVGIALKQWENFAAVDLFDLRHARMVLTSFGQAFGVLPDRIDDLNKAQKEFLNQAIGELAQDGRIISVRLALFAEMVKTKPWTPNSLAELGGAAGVGVKFLEETFTTVALRRHQRAAQAVLKALLPESGSNIKGHMRSHEELLATSGYTMRPQEFSDLVWILDKEVRLISPTNSEATDYKDGEQPATAEGKFYQLTHDYLVPSIREWLTRKQRETKRGRAELRLAERSSLWNSKPENRHLPSALEWANIRLLTKRRDWSEPQLRMMKRAGRVHVLRGLGLAALIAVVIWGGVEGYATMRASSLIESLKTASTADVEPIIKQLLGYRRWSKPGLVRLLRDSEKSSRDHLHASLALLPMDASQAGYLYDRLLNSDPIELPVIWKVMREYHQVPLDRLWKVLNDPKTDPDQRFRAACALASAEATVEAQRWDAVSRFVTDRLLGSVLKNPSHYPSLIKTFRPVRDRLVAPLSQTFREGNLESERSLATSILSDYAADRPDVLANLLMDASPPQFAILFPKVQAVGSQALTVLESELVRKPTPEANEDDKDKLAQRQARAAVALVRLGRTEKVWSLLRHSPDPRLRSFLVNRLSLLGADPQTLVAELDRLPTTAKPTSAPGQQFMDAVLFHPETSMRRALILALGTYRTEGLSSGDRELLIANLLDLYRNDPDAGIHGAAEWTLRQWKNDEKLKVLDAELSKLKDRGDRRWFVNSQGQTFAVIEGPVEFKMGSPPTELDRDSDEILHRVVIPRRFAIAAKEVSKQQWQAFVKKNPEWALNAAQVNKYSPDPGGPMSGFSWYIAAAFCNWLSEQEGLPKDQWCYLPAENGTYTAGMTIPANILERKGYRLPTEAEWEYSCRSGSVTSRYYGHSLDLLDQYARYQVNSKQHAWTCGSLRPNELGLFDMLGNVYEWVQDEHQSYKADTAQAVPDNIISHVNENPRLLRGGAFTYLPADVRSALRFWNAPAFRNASFGFRPSRTYD